MTRTRLGSAAAAAKSARGANVEGGKQRVEDEKEDETKEEGEVEKDQTKEQGKKLGFTPVKNKRKGRYICKGGEQDCGLQLTDKDDCIMCEGCDGWFHPKCQELSEGAFAALSEHDLMWVCNECRPHIRAKIETGRNVINRIEEVETKLLTAFKGNTPNHFEKMEAKLAEMEKSLTEELTKQKKDVERALQSQKDVALNLPKYCSDMQRSTQELRKIVVDKENRDAREKNIIIHNIPESSAADPEARKKHDVDSFNNIVHSLLGENTNLQVEKVFRIGKKKEREEGQSEPKPRLMLVCLKKKEEVEDLLRKRWNLKEVGFNNVYLTRDLPQEERIAQQKLRKELAEKGRETHRIFRGKVVPRQ